MKVTIAEVAKKAGVSLGTASRALNGYENVSKDNLRAVGQAAKTLGYKPLRQRNAKTSLKSLKDGGLTIGLLLLGMDRSLESLPVVAKAIRGVKNAVTETHNVMFLEDLPTLREKNSLLDRINLDGVIVKGALQGSALMEIKNSRIMEQLKKLPSVWLLGKAAGFDGDTIRANDQQAGQMAAKYLFDKGHRVVAYINPRYGHVNFDLREQRFVWAAENLGAKVLRFVADPPEEWVIPLCSVLKSDHVDELVEKVITASPAPTAIFSPADSISILIYRSLASRGLTVGKDISLISCNYEEAFVSGLYPSLTTIDIHADIIGALAVEQLIWRLKNTKYEESFERTVSADIVEGGSVAEL